MQEREFEIDARQKLVGRGISRHNPLGGAFKEFGVQFVRDVDVLKKIQGVAVAGTSEN